ncbi:glycerol-3-phosphate responsive antiterminator [Staphylococcus agnetis]|uniref:glycerol-3-phosphate responsive antiterminator n=1 Tax=Staphylococcus agnetis TaxID=985762 RepID=UPI0004E39913|nr:glycerol-3-phosphate responsive antiterminator [Staphylococcus agnetis]KFE42821.1 glycerol uptake operon antiterminator regulatory protein [Staphylococcus agnetis]NJH66299.1 glycerol-3-phosphate responsive antiterminator GlpP [Staphylococcus agnetis]NJH97818.1 glycerol-3-phosphate responsive antiterminator GlpP [Staphylococcus agnetis]PTH46427.1 glycerol-3-phosphate responsive antiterminator [Staphylococcus agnetis]PTH74063.1 glycerol-3-phosphate responsive antiterminator [Staphylococcus ag
MKPNILPAIRSMKSLEKLTQTDYKTCVILDTHIGHLKSMMQFIHSKHLHPFIHIDLIKGMSHDEYACEYIIQSYKPKGIVSTKSKVIKKAKALGVITIFRVFIIDSHALERSISLIQRIEPDFVEVLPGIANKVIERIYNETGVKVIAGGLISTEQEVNSAIESGASYVTTSEERLW